MTHAAFALPYTIRRDIVLSRAEVLEALTAAVLARAGALAGCNGAAVRALKLDTRVAEGGAVEVLGVAASVEAGLDPALLEALSRETGHAGAARLNLAA